MPATLVTGQAGVSGGATLMFAQGFGLISESITSPDPHAESLAFNPTTLAAIDLPLTKADVGLMNTSPVSFAAQDYPITRTDTPYLPTVTGFYGYTTGGTTGSTTCINAVVGSTFTTPASTIYVTGMWAYVTCTTANKNFNMAIYNNSKNLVVQCTAVAVTYGASAQWVFFTPQSLVSLSGSTAYYIVVWCNSVSGTGAINYNAGTTNQGETIAETYATNFPASLGTLTTNNNKYSVYVDYYE